MKLSLILLCCGLSLGAFSQQKAPADSLKKWRQDTTALGQRLILLRSQAVAIQAKLQQQFYRCHAVQEGRDTLHDLDPKVYQFHWDSITNEVILCQNKMAATQNTFDGILVQLDSTIGAQNAAVQRLQAASQQHKRPAAAHK